MLSPAYLTRKLTSPIPTKDGGTLSTIGEACEYVTAISKERKLRPHWQRVRELMLQEADVAAFSSRVRLAVLRDAKLEEPIPCNAPRSGFMIMRRIDRGVLARAVGRGAPRPHCFRRMAPALKHGRRRRINIRLGHS